MKPDDTICYCYHVPMRKLVNFAKRVKPSRPSLMTECLGAGTGCGLCIPFLIKIATDPEGFELEGLTPDEYAARRSNYRKNDPKNKFDSADGG